MTFLNLNLF